MRLTARANVTTITSNQRGIFMEIEITEQTMRLARILQAAVDRALKGEPTFIRVYQRDGRIHVGELLGDAAREIGEWIDAEIAANKGD